MSSEFNETQKSEEDIFKILVASDIHLGYNEKDSIRGNDSFIAFEEILESAVANAVDFILLGGDLFHDANPSPNTLHKCITLLRRYTLGDKPIEIELLSDQSLNFAESLNKGVNYEDPNINISIPVFSIHGNHDDPSGFGRLSSLDLLAVSGLVNYFGKWVDLTKINVNPIMMKKGESQLALYGLSHIHDNRLVRLFREFKVVMEKPDESTGEWFNLMVLHQNRADRGPKNFVPEDILPDFLHAVIWGHEHDCRILPEENIKRNFFVIQPGSSVATSLSEGESLQKHCALLYIYKQKLKLVKIPLKTVRPFVFDSINLSDYVEEYELDGIDASEKVIIIAKAKIEEMLLKANEKITNDDRQPRLPLIRLRICYTNESQMFNGIRFGQQYNEKVANPMDMILFKRSFKKNKIETKEFDKGTMEKVYNQEDVGQETRVEEMVDRYFEEVDESKKLQMISSKILSEMCYRLVERSDANAAENIIKFYKEKANNFLLENLPGEDDIKDCITKFRSNSDVLYGQVLKMLDERGTINKTSSTFSFDNLDNAEENGESVEKMEEFLANEPSSSCRRSSRTNAESTRGTRGRGRGRGSRGGKIKAELNISKVNNKQPSISDMMLKSPIRESRTSRKNIVYEISDSD